MRQRTLHLFILLVATFVLLSTTATAAFGAELFPNQQASTPTHTPLTQEGLEQFWQEMYPSAQPFGIAAHTNVYTTELLAKASPDECIEIPMGNLPPGGFPFPGPTAAQLDCPDGQQPKVNEAYVWGMTDYEETIWFGTAPNVHCLVMGGYLSATVSLPSDSYICEFGNGPYVPPLPEAIGDWRPPSFYLYDNEARQLTDMTPSTGLGFVHLNRTLGIRSAATYGDYVLFAGPALTPTASINIFLYDAANRTFRGSANLPGYTNIRKWLDVHGVLYTAVGTPTGGAVLRYTGNPASANPADWFQFVRVGTLDSDGAELALHEGRIFVNTWPSFNRLNPAASVVAGLYMSPLLPDGGLLSDSVWTKVFSYDEYEPDPVIAATYGGGALHSYQGDLFWGTMHVPFLATQVHLAIYASDYVTGGVPLQAAALSAMLGSQRAIAIFQGRDFGTPDQAVEVAYGMPELPVFDVNTLSWYTATNGIGEPKYGLAGFNNLYNNYTWSMAEYDGQLFVGTMDWSYLINDMFETILSLFELPLDITITLPDSINGADLYRFYSTTDAALPQSQSGVGNYTNYGVRNLLGRDDGLYLGMANPMNLLTDLTDDKPEGGWELLRLTRHLIPLTVNMAGNGSGSVVSDPAGIDCGATCNSSYDYGSSVVLTPAAAAGSHFTGWSGACLGLDPCQVTLLESQVVTANFAIDTYPLTVVLAGNGSGNVVSLPAEIGCSQPSCSADFSVGTTVALSAVAFSGSSFDGWSGACTGSEACQVTISPGTTVVTATFNQNPQAATLEIEGLPFVGAPLTLTATLNMNPITACSWDFGDGITESCAPGVAAAGVDAVQDISIQTTHTYSQTGVYLVTVTASNDAGSVTAAQEITIQAPTAEEPGQQPPQPGALYFPYLNR
ncbi:MAG: PKD domain-containing protein [Caldilineaceae bacterium]|nr:PKD domain-containing protein [Caldilineaceae bacterium]